MNHLKRLSTIAVLALVVLATVLLACQSQPPSSAGPSSSPSASPSIEPTPTIRPTPDPTPVPTADPEAEKRSVLNDVRDALEEVAPGSAVAVEQRTIGDIRLAGVVAPPALRDDVIAAVLEVDRVHTVDASGLVDQAFGSDLVLPAPQGDGAGLEWNPATEFNGGADAANPAPDRLGNPAVWGYLFDESSAADGYVHDPSGYAPMPTFDGSMWGREGYLYLIVGADTRPGTMRLHPFGGRVVSAVANPVLQWRSPVSGYVHVIGNFTVGDPSCNNLAVASGVIFTIDRGAANLVTAIVDAGGSSAFNVWTRVAAGESLYFMVDPGHEAGCDTTLLRLNIIAR